MTGNVSVINTDVIPATQDALWDTQPADGMLAGRPVLVICPAFTPGSGEEEQLTGILSAGCKLTNEHYDLLQLAPDHKMAWWQIKKKTQPKVVLLFGLHPQQLGIGSLFRLSEVNNFDGCKWVPAYPLGQLIQDKAAKGQLWNNALKPIFEQKIYGNIV